jgi:predicted RNA polymerase sigma factor
MIVSRLSAVHLVLDLLFNEGYNATSADTPVRAELYNDRPRRDEHPGRRRGG